MNTTRNRLPNKVFVDKVNRMFKGVITCVETERDCFTLQASSPWLQENHVVNPSKGFKTFVETWFYRNAGRRVNFNNTSSIFWLGEQLGDRDHEA